MSVERRPDPDELLARVKEAESRQTRGKLKIFFGAAAGVGKTYAMLEAAREQRQQGVDVVVGWVETHGRADTEALLRDLAISAVPFLYGFTAAVVIGVPLGIVMGWRERVSYALDPIMTVFYASPLVALAPLVIVFFGVGVSGKAIIIFVLSVFPFIFNAQAGVRAIDPLLINVVRSLGGSERDLYLKVLIPGVLPYIVAGARIAVGRGLIGILVGEFFAASEGIGYAIARFGDLFALDKMFACIFVIMIIAVALTEGIRWAERAAFPWRVGQ